MSYRIMRLIVMFDLPMLTREDKKRYTDFRKFLLKNGFLMLQESIYTKIALNHSACKAIENKVQEKAPSEGLINILTVTERQYNNMVQIYNSCDSDIIRIQTSERFTRI